MEGAAEVQEDEDTQVEIPVDQLPSNIQRIVSCPKIEPKEITQRYHILRIMRPAEIIDEEESGGKENEDVEEEKEEEKEDLLEIKGDVKEKEVEESPEKGNVDPPRVNGGTNEENGEELDEVSDNEHHQEKEEEITLAKGDGDGDGPKEDESDPQRPSKPEVKITSPQEHDNSEQNKEYAAVA